MLTIVQAEIPAQVSTAREMIEEYAAWLEFKLCFQGYEEEIQSLPGKYALPAGRLLLALWDGHPAGVIALRPLEEPGVCEMKRLYVRPEFRGRKLGCQLAETVIAEARRIGYHAMRLDTLPSMAAARALYQTLGFRAIPRYNDNPSEGVIYLEYDWRHET